ncbi:hypothetical protein I4U23_013006 [Adineta vaga]|nr:hypothetical protein I4U23_013006 [Adineta vaga]
MKELKTKQSMNREDFLFTNVTELKLRVHREWSVEALHFISMLVNVLELRTLSFQSDFHPKTASKIVDNLMKFLQKTSHLRSLIVLPLDINGQYHVNMMTLCSIVPVHIENFALKVQNLDDMREVLENLIYLSSVSFNYPHDRKIISIEIIEWLINNGEKFSYIEKEYSIHFWFSNH